MLHLPLLFGFGHFHVQTLIWSYYFSLGSANQTHLSSISETIVESFYSVNYFVKYSTVDCKYLLFLQCFFFQLKSKQHKNANIAIVKKHLETHKTKTKITIFP